MALNVCLKCLLPQAYHTSAGCPGQTKPTWICGRCGSQLNAPQAPHWCPPKNETIEKYRLTPYEWETTSWGFRPPNS